MNMIDYQPTEQDTMSGEEFCQLAESVLLKHGEPLYPTNRASDARVYRDNWVIIRSYFNGLALEVTRAAQSVEIQKNTSGRE